MKGLRSGPNNDSGSISCLDISDKVGHILKHFAGLLGKLVDLAQITSETNGFKMMKTSKLVILNKSGLLKGS